MVDKLFVKDLRMNLGNAGDVKDKLKNLSKEEQLKVIRNIYDTKFLELVTSAYAEHSKNFADDIEMCQLISVKTGGCPEDCGYCSQSNKHETEIKLNALLVSSAKTAPPFLKFLSQIE